MSQGRPITARELARLFRAFAHFLETAEEQPPPEPQRAPRRRRRAQREASETPRAAASPLTAERAAATLRRLGVIP